MEDFEVEGGENGGVIGAVAGGGVAFNEVVGQVTLGDEDEVNRRPGVVGRRVEGWRAGLH